LGELGPLDISDEVKAILTCWNSKLKTVKTRIYTPRIIHAILLNITTNRPKW